MTHSPIALFVFNRADKTTLTVEALKECHESKQSDLYIFADAPRSKKDIDSVNEVRNYIKTITGFKTVTIIESPTNKGLAKSIISGVSRVIEESNNQQIIVLEDDVIVSKVFLYYMNRALNLYKNDTDIFSISGYSPKFDIQVPEGSTYLSKRFFCWGWGTWADRWETADWDMKYFNSFIKSRKKRKEFNEAGKDLWASLLDFKLGLNNSWAIRAAYTCFNNKQMNLCPINSLTKNIGMDDSGTHYKNNSISVKMHNSFNFNKSKSISETTAVIELNKPPIKSKQIDLAIKKIYTNSIIRQMINWVKRNRYILLGR